MSLDIDKILSHVKHNSVVREVVHEVLFFDKVTSTNRIALEMASDGLPGGIVILAEEQSKGKGRLGRSWFSPPECNIILSILLRPCLPMREYPLFSPVTAVGVIDGIDNATGIQAGIKWPNDIMVGEKKVGGVLLESGAGGDQAVLVVGLGINANLNQTDFPDELQSSATSLREILGQEIDRTVLVIALLEGIARQVTELQTGHKTAVLQAVKARCQTLGKKIRVKTAKKVFEGWAEEIESDGVLRIRMGDQSRRRILTGEITHLRDAGIFQTKR